MTATLLEVADELYAGSLGDFTPSRDARAKELKAAGDTELAQQVKALRKPSLAAWVVDLFVRREADQVDQVLAMGAALREAQAGMSGEELRALTRQRRQLTAAVTQQARSLAGEEGVRVTQAVADQVEATLTAAMVDERCGEAVRSGLLVAALAATGVDEVDVASAVAVPEALGFVATARAAEPRARPDLRVVPDPDADAKARAAAEEALAEAEEEVAAARSAYDDAGVDVERLQARQLQLEAEIDELKRRIAALEESYDEVEDELGDADEARAEALEVLERATAARDAAAATLDALP
jgi:DNA repair exonuclease SbcCD ATPase subunit